MSECRRDLDNPSAAECILAQHLSSFTEYITAGIHFAVRDACSCFSSLSIMICSARIGSSRSLVGGPARESRGRGIGIWNLRTEPPAASLVPTASSPAGLNYTHHLQSDPRNLNPTSCSGFYGRRRMMPKSAVVSMRRTRPAQCQFGNGESIWLPRYHQRAVGTVAVAGPGSCKCYSTFTQPSPKKRLHDQEPPKVVCSRLSVVSTGDLYPILSVAEFVMT